MSPKKAVAPLAVIVTLGVLATTSAARSGDMMSGDIANEVTHATPCSLDGFNPSWHSDFDNPAAAKAYGFVKSPDGTWHLDKSCAQARAVSEQAPPHGPRRVKKKQP
jgi:hypothetical protein